MKKQLTKLKKAFFEKNSEAIEQLIDDIDFSENVSDYTEILCQLLVADWHIKHEDIAFILEDIRDPLAVDYLYIAAQKNLEYLSYDDSRQLAKKCIWALWKIGTEEAIAKIEQLATFEDNIVRGYAVNQLNKNK